MSRSSVPHVVAIAGPSGSGKTSLARLLAAGVPGGGVVVALDAYYRDQRGVPDDQINVDVPDALDHALLIRQVAALAAGQPVRQPVYDYATHARLDDTRRVDPAPFVIVEGLFALYWSDVRAVVTTPVYLNLAHDACLARRVARDVAERGREADAVRQHYQRSVRPMYDRHVHPTRAYARLLLDATQPLEALVEKTLAALAVR
ncbi:MAG: uridine kinase [Candidatus Krumholzibacteria bacterium]|nr:uridine kinase [Candidatus Krumholzibacteria bacterium]MDH4338038.1 uridine kinase [Candidatus Krumholzibacteria bacterium]MDH5269389.1 uridine kinase [Candidatus Krumholzibacteria bacterium]MDH5627081.1 uridine kinase [Candidatus Krumholzibacteria bacterium]